MNILYVCVENSNRSQMAEAFTRIHGENVMAHSAGSEPSGVVNPRAIAAMKELGYDLSLHESKSVDSLPSIVYDHVITMGCGEKCPNIPAKNRDDWPLPDPKSMPPKDFNVVRDEIERRVLELLSK